MLATGDFFAADQFTRDNLIKIGGPGPVGRGFVYWTEVDSLPEADLCTMERLWLLFSNGKFGYSVQKRIWDVENADFDKFIRRIGTSYLLLISIIIVSYDIIVTPLYLRHSIVSLPRLDES